MKKTIYVLVCTLVLFACKREGCTDPNALNYNEKAKRDNGSCYYYVVPDNYMFNDANGNNTVNYTGQTDRLNQLREMVVMMKSGTTQAISAQALKDMFSNANGNGNGNFSFTSSKQLKDKCFSLDQPLFESWLDSISFASSSFASSASNGQAGTLTTGTSTYLFNQNGREYLQFIEKGLMGAVFMYQALNVYFGSGKMDVDNTTSVDPTNGLYYTLMEHHFDEAFGYFGVSTDFPTTPATDFWGKYCMAQNTTLNSNSDMMTHFRTGRAAITGKRYDDRDAAIAAIRAEWEQISAFQALTYIDQAISAFGSDNAKFLHTLNEAYAFCWNLRYAPIETRKMSQAQHAQLMTLFKSNFWSMGIGDLNGIKQQLQTTY
jgi:hypothetical protein